MKLDDETERILAPLLPHGLGSATYNPIAEAVGALVQNGGTRTGERLVAAVVTILARSKPGT